MQNSRKRVLKLSFQTLNRRRKRSFRNYPQFSLPLKRRVYRNTTHRFLTHTALPFSYPPIYSIFFESNINWVFSHCGALLPTVASAGAASAQAHATIGYLFRYPIDSAALPVIISQTTLKEFKSLPNCGGKLPMCMCYWSLLAQFNRITDDRYLRS